MQNIHLKLEDLINFELEKIKRKRPFIQDVEVSYEHNERGEYFSKLVAKTKKKTINLSQSSRCPETGIRKLFNNLFRKLKRKRISKANKVAVNFKQVG